MAYDRIYNFSAGPSMLPLEVLESARDNLLNFEGCGMSVMEMSHRSKVFDNIIVQAEAQMRKVMNIPDNYKVLFMQGGASLQFAMIPMNLMTKNGKADYVLTGNFSSKAAEEAAKYGKVNIAASTKDEKFCRIPQQNELKLDPEADYVHICFNNTIYGSCWNYIPDTGDVPLVADMSSCIMSRPIDVSKFGMIYAGAQKNVAPLPVSLSSSSAKTCSATTCLSHPRFATIRSRPRTARCTTRLPAGRSTSASLLWIGCSASAASRSWNSATSKKQSFSMTISIPAISIQQAFRPKAVPS